MEISDNLFSPEGAEQNAVLFDLPGRRKKRC
jgi:hypothetical protein